MTIPNRQIVVQPGETLGAIARRELGDANRWRELGAQVGIATSAQARNLQPGTRLNIPTPVVAQPKPIAPAVSQPLVNIAPTQIRPTQPTSLGNLIPTQSQQRNVNIGFDTGRQLTPVANITNISPQQTNIRPQTIQQPTLIPQGQNIQAQAPIRQPAILHPDVIARNEQIENITRQIREKQGLIDRAQAIGLREDEPIPEWLYGVSTPEEAARLVKPMRIQELERQAFQPAPQNFEQIFTQRYNEAGLSDIRNRIESLDNRILEQRRQLIAEEGEINENPWLSEASRVGRVRRLYDMAQKDIELLSDERKLLADRYNDGLTQARDMATRIIADWGATQQLRQREIEHLEERIPQDPLLTLTELEAINRGLPANQRLPFGTTRSQAQQRGIAPALEADQWQDFTNMEKRRLS